MFFCSKCGTKHADSAEYCVKCGAKLKVSIEKSLEKRIEKGAEEFGKRAEAWGENFGKQAEEECFGLPHGGTIFGLIIGLIIILLGVTSLAGVDIDFWPLIIIIFGLLIVGGALYSLTQRRHPWLIIFRYPRTFRVNFNLKSHKKIEFININSKKNM